MALPTFAYRLIGRFSTSRLDRRLHPLLYRLAGGRGITGHVLGCEMILLTSTGRRSGEPRTVALFAFPWDRPPGSLAVVASRGGSRRIPDWYRNLQARPAATIRMGRRSWPVQARDAEAEEYAAIFEQAATAFPGYRLYRAESPVRIPIVVLEPAGVEAGPEAGP